MIAILEEFFLGRNVAGEDEKIDNRPRCVMYFHSGFCAVNPVNLTLDDVDKLHIKKSAKPRCNFIVTSLD